jgi:hypothetical protein
MSENEIVKHVEAAYKAAKDPEKNWLHKLKEILIEIFIIVFAVSLSIWFHNWSDSLHEHKEEREFLVGLQKDINADLENADSSRAFYARQIYKLQYFQHVGAGEPLNIDSLKAYQDVFFSSTTFPGNGVSFIAANVLNAHDSCIARCHQLIGQIDKELK